MELSWPLDIIKIIRESNIFHITAVEGAFSQGILTQFLDLVDIINVYNMNETGNQINERYMSRTIITL